MMEAFLNYTDTDLTMVQIITTKTSVKADSKITLNQRDSTTNFSISEAHTHRNVSYKTNTDSSSEVVKIHPSTADQDRSFLDISSTASSPEVTKQTDTDVPDTFPVSNYNISVGYSVPFEDVFINGSQLYSGTSAHEAFVNSAFHLSRRNETALSIYNDTSFSMNLSTWLTVVPHLNFDNSFLSVDGDVNTSFITFKVIILGFISIVGSLGNILVIWSVVKERHLHRPPFYFLLSMGVTDLSRSVFCVPVVMTTVLHGSKWRHGESACKLFAFATSFFVFSSALSLLAIAIDRHVSIVYSKTYRRRSLGIANLVVAIIIWVIAFSVSFPPVVGVGDYVFIPDESQCAYQHKHYKLNDSISSVLVFIAILFLTYFLYFRIFRFLRSHRRMRPLQHTPALSSNWAFIGPGANGQAFINWLNGFGGQAPVRQGGQRTVQRLNFGRVVNLSTAKNEHLTRLFLVLTFVFGATWFPYIILSLWRIFFDTLLIPSAYITVSAWLGYGQLAICPLAYLFMRGPIRKPSKTTYEQTEKREFLLENKTGK